MFLESPHLQGNKILSEIILQYIAIDQQYGDSSRANRLVPQIESSEVRLNPFLSSNIINYNAKKTKKSSF